MISYTWTILNMEVYTQLEDKNDVVYLVHWKCNAEEITQDGVFSSNSNDIAFIPTENLSSFTDYQSLTQQQVLDWVYAVVDKELTEARLAVEIANAKAPKTQVLTPPWQ